MSQRNPSGAVHPTRFLVAWFLAGVALHRLWPLALPGAALLEPLKFVLAPLGIALFAASAFVLRRNDTTMEHKDATTALVTRGPYRISRNPIYVALVLVLLAIAVDAGSVWFCVLTVGFWAAVQWLTVMREEAYLEREFGAEYLRYKSAVRQWL
jgi:protein-S-isoprenylcysteine O-methyltransferase Ste14